MDSNNKWIQFLRHYGPIPQNDNMYDETIQRSARRQKIQPIEFEHPYQSQIFQCFVQPIVNPISIILTGTAGDGKTNLCRQIWKQLFKSDDEWESNNPLLSAKYNHQKDKGTGIELLGTNSTNEITIHFIRDLSGWAPQQGAEWEPEKEKLLLRFCHSLFNSSSNEIFIIAANDGQLIESFRRLKWTDDVKRTLALFEELLVTDSQDQPGIRLKFFNLSHTSSAELFDRALIAFLDHPGWSEIKEDPTLPGFWGDKCPIRHNYELLHDPLVQQRLRALLDLCDYSGFHIPIRQILLLLTNAVLGHPDVKDNLMVSSDVSKLIQEGVTSEASLFNNIFGGNLSDIRRRSITIFDCLERFQIGYETSNRIDNLLIFGEGDENLGSYFKTLVANDKFYGADALFYAAKKEYIEGTDETDDKSKDFLNRLVSQRRGLFFKVPKDKETELNLWELTVFKFAGEYLDSVLKVLANGNLVRRPILYRMVKGLNRVFTGMFINSERELLLATSGNYSQAKLSRILLERISVEPSKGEKIILGFDNSNGHVILSVYFTPSTFVNFDLNLIRFEFLSRVATDGALPTSFSKECYEDFLALKSQLIAAWMKRQEKEQINSQTIGINILSLSEQGAVDSHFVEVVP